MNEEEEEEGGSEMMRATTLTTTLTSSNAASLLLSSSLPRKISSFNTKANHRGKKSAFGVIVMTPQRRGRFGRTNSLKNSSAGECELVECEVDFGFADDEKDALTKACVANINGNTIDASALRNVTLMNSKGNLEKLPLTGDKDVVVYLRHLG